jgi:flagellar hook-basal body complex protein FliE
MGDLRIDGPGPLRYTPLGRPAETAGPGEDFGTTLRSALQEVNRIQLDAGNDVNRVVAGEEVDLHEVMISSAEAGIAFEMMMEIRNKLLEAYQEVMRMQV